MGDNELKLYKVNGSYEQGQRRVGVKGLFYIRGVSIDGWLEDGERITQIVDGEMFDREGKPAIQFYRRPGERNLATIRWDLIEGEGGNYRGKWTAVENDGTGRKLPTGIEVEGLAEMVLTRLDC